MLFREMKRMCAFSTALSDRTNVGTYQWLKNNKELINVATSRAKDKLFCSQTAKNWSVCMQDRQTMIFMNLRSTSKPTEVRDHGKTYQFPCTWHPAVFYRYRKMHFSKT